MRSLQCAGSKPARVHRRGISIVLVGVVLIALIGFVSLAIDIGRVRLASAQLQAAADASARAGAWSLPVGSQDVIDETVYAASSNPCIDSATAGARSDSGVTLKTDEDVHFGVWNQANFTFVELFDDPSTQQDERRAANAVRVQTRRVQARGNPIKLIFAPVIGVFRSDVEREAIAYIHGGQTGHGFIGLDAARSNGNKAAIDGTNGPGTASLFSNGDIDLSNSDVYGDARAGIGKTLYQNSNSLVTGWAADLTDPLVYPAPVAPTTGLKPFPKATNKGFTFGDKNSTATNPSVYVGQFTVKPKEIDVTGYAVIYLHGNLDIEGSAIINATAPKDASHLTIYMLDPGSTVDLGGSVLQYAHIYAPLSTVKVHGGVSYTGWIVGKTLDWLGNAQMHDDGTANLPSKPFVLSLVR
jgi:Flp pilus assembly protein TadG